MNPGPSATVQPITGGCQCGAVRYEASIDLAGTDEPEGFAGVHFCHCTMCRRATSMSRPSMRCSWTECWCPRATW